MTRRSEPPTTRSQCAASADLPWIGLHESVCAKSLDKTVHTFVSKAEKPDTSLGGMTVIAQEKKIDRDSCHRCGGLMVPEETGDPLTRGWRCISCGERTDPVILAHREQHRSRQETVTLLRRANSAKLN